MKSHPILAQGFLQTFAQSALFRGVAHVLIALHVYWGLTLQAMAANVGDGTPPAAELSSPFYPDLTQVLSIGDYKQTAVTRINRTQFDFTYTASVNNASAQTYHNVKATLISRNPATVVTDNSLSFNGPVSAFQSLPSQDSFTIRQDRSIPFNPNDLVWTFQTNQPPVANAGPDNTVLLDSEVELNGTASTDVDGNPISYHWTLIERPTASSAALDNSFAPKPRFTADLAGRYISQLIVNDGYQDSVADSVVISTENAKPIADAGPDQTVATGDTVFLNGNNSSDPDGDTLQFAWTLSEKPTGSDAELSMAETANPLFIANKPGRYQIHLTVTDGHYSSDADLVIVSTRNSAPVADAGPDQSFKLGDPALTLHGNASHDIDGQALSFRWSIINAPPGNTAEITPDNAAEPSFNPHLEGLYILQLIVNDGELDSAADTVTIEVKPQANRKPTIVSVPVTTAGVGKPYSYDVDAQDPDANDTLTYSLSGAPSGMSIDSSSGLIQWLPAATGSYAVSIQVKDKAGLSDSQSYNLVVVANHPPQITSSPLTQVILGDSYAYAFVATDPDNDKLTFALTHAPAGMNIDSASGLIQWTPAANQAGLHNVSVSVKDSGGLTDSQSFNITVISPNRAPSAQDAQFTAQPQQILLDFEDGQLPSQKGWSYGSSCSQTVSGGVDLAENDAATISGGMLNLDTTRPVATGVGGYYALNNIIDPKKDLYFEARLRVKTLEAAPPDRSQAFALAVLTDQGLYIAEVGDNEIHSHIPQQNGQSAPVDVSKFHTYTLIKPAGSASYKIQVDGQTLITQDAYSGYPAAFNQLYFGDGTCLARNGSVEIDYVRVEQKSPNNSIISPAPGVLAGASDPDGDLLTAVLVEQPAHGTLTLNANGSFTYLPNAGFVGTDSFSYAASDGKLDSAPSTVTILLGDNNLPPIITSTPNTSRWMELNPTGTRPDPKYAGSVQSYDEANDRLIVFGGQDASNKQLNDVWVLSHASGLGGTPEWKKLEPTGTTPSPRAQFISAYDATANRLIVYGGCSGFCSPLADAWVLTHANGLGGQPEWLPLPASNSLGFGAGGYDAINNRLIVFGGLTGGKGSDTTDVKVLLDANGVGEPRWLALTPDGTPPPARGHSQPGVYDPLSNTLIVFGGHSSSSISGYNDVWVLNHANGLGGTPTWTQLNPSGSAPIPRAHHTQAYDANSNHLMVFGGYDGDTNSRLNDSWILTHANGQGGTPEWIKLPITELPKVASTPTAGYSRLSNRLIAALGVGMDETVLNETWVLTNTSGNCAAGQACDYDVDASDADAGDSLSYQLISGPVGMSIDAASGQLQWTPTAEQVGDHAVSVRVKDNGGLAATQNFTLTVAPVAVPNVQGLAPEWAEAMLQAAGLNTGAKSSLGGAITLNFSTLPSEQGWEYTPGPAGALAESSLYSLANNELHMNTLGIGARAAGYEIPSGIDARLPLEIAIRALVSVEELGTSVNHFGFGFDAWPAQELFGVGLGTSHMEIEQKAGHVVIDFDATAFHNYLLNATPGAGLSVSVDGQVINNGEPYVYPYPNSYALAFGDLTEGPNTKAKVAAYQFTQPQIKTQTPAPGTLVNPGSAVDLAIRQGPATQTVPAVEGLTVALAEAELLAAGLQLGTVTEKADNNVSAGSVIKQKTVAGTHIMKDFKVDLIVAPSNGNHKPVIISTPITVANSSEPYLYDVDALDADPGDYLSYNLTAAPAGMTIDTVTGLIDWTPASGQAGNQLVTVEVQDTGGLKATQTFTVSVLQVSHAPIGRADNYTTSQDEVLNQPGNGVLSNDSDPDFDPLTAILVSGPTNGSLNLNADGSFVYTPNTGFVGSDSFTYKVSDGLLESVPVVVTISADKVNLPPTINTLPQVSEWKQIAPIGTPPSPRFGSGWSPYDEVNDRLILFGGDVYVPSHQHPADVWVLKNATGVQGSPEWLQITPSNSGPSGRLDHTAVYDPTSNRLILHGGCSDHCNPSADTWILTHANGLGGNSEWIQLPSYLPRTDHAAGYDPVSNRMVIYGGYTAPNDNKNDVAVLIDANGIGEPKWIALSPTGTPPPPRGNNSCAVYDPLSNTLIAFGGGTWQGVPQNDVWILSHANGLGGQPEWRQLMPTGTSPSQRSFSQLAYDPNGNRLVVVGGWNTSNNNLDPSHWFNDAWVLTHANGQGGQSEWSKLDRNPNIKPDPRGSAQSGYHRAANRLVITTGRGVAGQSETFNDTWVLTNASGNCTAAQPCNYDVDASDPDVGDSLSYELISGPAGMSIDPANGQLQWTPTAEQVGDHAVSVRVKDSGGLTVTQNFTLTVSPVAVPNVQGLAPEWAESLLQAAGLNTGAKSSLGGAVTLNFDTLPSEQGWNYFAFNNSVPENQIFSLVDGKLTQDSIGKGFQGSGANQYNIYGPVGNRLPHDISIQARVIEEEGAIATNSFGFCFGSFDGSAKFVTGLGTGQIQDQRWTLVSPVSFDNTKFHDYRLKSRPGLGSKLFVDNQLLVEAPPVSDSFASVLGETGITKFGDCSGGTNAKAEIAAYSFTQAQILTQTPAPGTLVKPASSVDLGIQDGPATQTVPDVVSQTQADAQNAIAAASLLVGTLATQASNVIPAGEVIKQKPVAGTHIMKDFKVDLVVSSGPVAGGACVAPPAGMVAWWSGDATAQDYVSADHGSPANGAGYAVGLVGSAFKFNGENQFIGVPDSPVQTPVIAITLEAWVYPNRVDGVHPIIAKYDSEHKPEQLSWFLGAGEANQNTGLRFGVYQSQSSGSGYDAKVIDHYGQLLSVHEWQHVVATFDTGTQDMKFYVNGEETPAQFYPGATDFISKIADSSGQLQIGSYTPNWVVPHGWDGLIDEASLYNRALTQTEIQAIYNAGSYGKCKTGLIIADAGPDSSGTTGEPVTLNGTASRDLDGKPISYAWTLIEKPDGSFTELENPATVSPSFVPDVAGDYLLRLTVNNGSKTSAPDTVKISASGNVDNQAPSITSSPNLNASVSTPYAYDVDAADPDANDILTYSLVEAPEGMSIEPETGEIHWVPSSNAMLLSVDISSGNLVSIDPANGHVNVVGALGQVVRDVDLAYLDQQLYAISTFHPQKAELIKINQKTGLASFIAQLNYQNSIVKHAEGLTQKGGKLLVNFAIDRDFTFSSQFGELSLTGNIIDVTSELADADGLATSPSGTIFFVNSEPQDQANYIGTVKPTQTLGSYSTQFGGVNDLDFAGNILFGISNDSAKLHVINSINGNLRVTIPLDRSGTYSGLAVPTANVTVKVTDRNGATDTQTFSISKAITVSDGQSHPPTISSAAVLAAQTGFPYSYDVDATDPDTGDVLTYSLTTAPTGMSIDSASGLIQWTPTVAQLGSQAVTVKVQDKSGLSDSQSFAVLVSVENRAPTITSTPPASVKALKLYSYAIVANDPDTGDKLSYSFATNTPTGMTIDVDSGLLQWMPPVNLVGVHRGISVKVTDKAGLSVTQTFDITVLPANRAPVINSSAPTVATENIAYSYAVQASDPDAGDKLSYALTTAPAGMSISAAGLITWVPSHAQLGEHAVTLEVKDQDGQSVTQNFNVKVEAATVAVPSLAGQTVAEAQATLTTAQLTLGGQTGAYDEAVPVNRIISQQPPAGVAVAKQSAVDVVISLGPAPVNVPSVVGLTEAAAEAALIAGKLTVGGKTSQFSDTVPAGNVISQNPSAGASVSKATPVDLLISSGPAPVNVPGVVGLTEAAATSAIVAAKLVVGLKTSQASNSVPAGNVISQNPPASSVVAKGSAVDLLISSGPEAHPLASILVQPDSPLLLTGETLTLSALGILDDGSSQTLSGASWSSSAPAVASVDNTGAIQALSEGQTVITVQKGNISATITVTVKAAAPGDTTFPDAAISAPAMDAVITAPTDIIGTASDANFLKYELSLSPLGENNFTVFKTGSSAVSNGVLGVLDPTLLLNDQYTLRLTVRDKHNNTATTETRVQIAREQKVGNFTLAFQDVNVPMACMPLSVTRVYDSRDKKQGDFGVGWRLDVKTLQLRESREMGSGWHVDVVNRREGLVNVSYYVLSPDDSHKVSLTLPDGSVEEFDLSVSPRENRLFPIGTVNVSYTPRPGTLGALAPVAPTSWDLSGNFGSVEFIDSDTNRFDPQQYIYTAPDGSKYLIDKGNGVQKVTCANEQTLSFGSNGISHSDGLGVTFTRDAQNRITAIRDPKGNQHLYSYNSAGDLILHTDPEANKTTFKYDYRHGLLEVTDPRNIKAVRNEYDADGRLIGNTDAAGKKIVYNHDLVNKTETITDRLGNVTVYDYDDKGNVIHQIDALGNETNFDYDGYGNQTRKIDALGRVTETEYDQKQQLPLKEIVDPNGLNLITAYTYHALGGVKKITDARNLETNNDYDASGNLLKTTDSTGAVTSYGYDKGGIFYAGSGLMTSKTDALDNKTTYNYDAQGRLIQETDAKNNVTSYTYDNNGNRTEEKRTRTKLGVGVETLTTSFEYDALNRLVKTTHPDGSVSRTVYNAIGKQAQTIDAAGKVTSYEYDDLGHLVKTTYPDGAFESSAYDAEGRRIESIDRAGRKTTYSYDKLGRLIQTTYPDATTSGTQYDEVGQVKTSIDALGHLTRYQYDQAGRRIKVIDASNSEDNPDCKTAGVTCFAYDKAGNQKTITDANGHVTEFVYDNANRRIEVKYPDGSKDQTGYDKLGRNISKTDQAGITTGFEYDALGRLIHVKQTVDDVEQVTTYGYDEVGNQLSQTDANGHTTLFAYDEMGRRESRRLPEGQVEEMDYDLSGNLISKTDFNQKTTTFKYDELNRLTQKTPDASLNEPPVLFSYTDSGQRAIMEDASGKTTYSYDNRDRLEKKITPQGILNYSYNGAGLLEVIQSDAVDGVHLQYQYDALNRLAKVIDHNLGTTQTVYGYDAVGNLASYQYANGVEHRYSYNKLNRLENLQVAKGAVKLAGYAYTLGPTGNRLSVAELSGRSVNYDYDALYRLKQENISGSASHNGRIAYTYDPVGNRRTRSSTVAGVDDQSFNYNANDQIVSNSEKYDDNGNTTGSDGQSYQYDSDNRLIDMNGGAVKVVYDGDGNRVSKTAAGVTTRYLVDTLNPTGYAQVLEERSGGQVAVVYGYGLDLISQNRKGLNGWKASYYGYDGHGSVRFLTDASGHVTDTYDYDAFGVLLGHTGNTVNSYLYSGEQRDSSLGLDYLRARYYDKNKGRFYNRDYFDGLLLEPLSLHKYVYSQNNPITNSDPTGLATLTEVSVTGAITGYLIATGLAVKYPKSFIGRAYHNVGLFLPDAIVIGVSGKFPIINKNIFKAFNVNFPFTGVSGELIWSVASAEFGAVFGYDRLSASPSEQDVSGSIYLGFIWNLWNFDHYSSSDTIGINIGATTVFRGTSAGGPNKYTFSGVSREIFSLVSPAYGSGSSVFWGGTVGTRLMDWPSPLNMAGDLLAIGSTLGALVGTYNLPGLGSGFGALAGGLGLGTWPVYKNASPSEISNRQSQ